MDNKRKLKQKRFKFHKFVLLLFTGTIMAFSACSTGSIQDRDSNETGSSVMQTSLSETHGTPEQTGTVNQSVSNTTSADQETSAVDDPTYDYAKTHELLNSMSLNEKIGQLFIVGFKGTSPDDDVNTMIRNYHAGGVILFKNNIDNPNQLLNLINSLKELNSKNKVPLFFSVDEEGGRISRLPDQIHKMPSNEEVGKRNDSSLSYGIGNTLAYELKAFGFNLDFAPVLDIFSNPKNTVIGDRAFGNEPGIVKKLGVQTMKGLENGGVISVVKHFPGHGDTLVDSHIGLPVVEYDLTRLKSFEFIPFQSAIDNQADAMMIAHILVKKIDAENPASMSKALITDILREQMGFSGVVFTDDMTMGAIVDNYDIGDAVVKSILAGSDLILVCHEFDKQQKAFNAIKEAVNNGTIPEERLNESVGRILMLKQKYHLQDKSILNIDISGINKEIDDCLTK